jgi:ADP-ribose pyrophosphatase YjhB (NUDIX family)
VAGDARERIVCTSCGKIHFENPKVLVACFAHWGEKLLLCRRRDEPGAGKWTSPGGFVETGETLQGAAARETAEETGLILDPQELVPYSMASLPHLAEIYVTFRIAIGEPTLKAGAESLDVGLFDLASMPWDHIAFWETESFYRMFFEELQRNQFSFHLGEIHAHSRARRSYTFGPPHE